MPRKISDEQRIMEYFDNAPLAKAEVVFELIKARIKNRQKDEGSKGPRTRGTAKPKPFNPLPERAGMSHLDDEFVREG